MKGEAFFPTAVIKISPWSIVALTLVIGLTLFVGPRELMEPASLTNASPASEEWWFAWYSALVALLPAAIVPTFLWLFPVAIFVLLVLLPFIDRSPHRGWRNRPVMTGFVILMVLAVLSLSWLRIQSSWTGRPNAAAPATPEGVVLATDAEEGRLLFASYGCTSCHSVGGSGSSHVGTDLARLNQLYSQAELSHYILHPPAGVAMPSYEGRLSAADLDRVVAYVLVAQTFRRVQE